MLIYSIIVFAVAAIGGLVLAARVLGGKFAPWRLSLLHALLGAIGLILLLVGVINGEGAGRALAALALLVLAALGGFLLAGMHFRRKLAPKAIVVTHAGVAVVGFLTLLSVVLGF